MSHAIADFSCDRKSTTGSENGFYRLIFLAFLLVIIVAAVIGLTIHKQGQQEWQTQATLIQSYDARSQIKTVLALLIDAETAQRGYIITGVDKFLEPYERMQGQLPAAFSKLTGMLEDDPEQARRAAQLQSLSKEVLANIHATILARKANRVADADALILGGRGKQLMDNIRTVAADLIAQEQAHVNSARLEELQNRKRARRLVFGLLASLIIVILVCAVLVMGHLNRRKQFEAELRRREIHVRGQRKIAETINQAQSFYEALDRIGPILMELLSVSHGRGFVVSWDKGSQSLVMISQWPNEVRAEQNFMPASLLLEEVSRRELSFESLSGDDTWRLILPVRDQGRAVACRELYGKADMDEAKDIATYAGLQLTQAAERQRILDSLNEALTCQKAIFDNAIDAILIVNESGTIESFNPAAERILGYTATDILRRHITTVLPYGASDAHAAMSEIREAWGGFGQILETVARHSNDATFPVDVAISEMRLGDRQLLVTVLRDATERKRLEQLKNEFVSTVSHELRTPLTSISGSLGLLAGGAGGPLSPAVSRLVGIAHQNCDRLVRLINDVLDIQKIESGYAVFRMQPVRLAALLQNVLDSNQAYAESFKVQLRIEGVVPDIAVFADPDRLMQVLTNLVSNAVKFSPPEDTVTLAVRQEGDSVRLSVRDNGPGIPVEFQNRIFSKFAQAESVDTRQKDGTGLGLAIVREIVTLLKGRTWFESATGAGTVFHVELPILKNIDVANSGSAIEPRPDSASDREQDKSILICVGESQAVGQVLVEMLARVDLRSETANSSEEAISRINVHSYAAIVILISSRQNDVIDLIRVIREREHTHRTPVLIVGAEFNPATRTLRTDAFEVVDWLDSPAQQETLIGRLHHLLRTEDAARPAVLHVDDDPDILAVVRDSLSGSADVTSANSLADAYHALSEKNFDLVVLDLMLAEGSGLELLPALKDAEGRALPTIIFSAHLADAGLPARVDAALTKSQTGSLDKLVQEVLRLARRAR